MRESSVRAGECKGENTAARTLAYRQGWLAPCCSRTLTPDMHRGLHPATLQL